MQPHPGHIPPAHSGDASFILTTKPRNRGVAVTQCDLLDRFPRRMLAIATKLGNVRAACGEQAKRTAP